MKGPQIIKQSMNPEWKMDRPYPAPLWLSDPADEGGLCKAQVNFGRLLRTAGVRGTIDPRSILLAAQDAHGKVEKVPCRISEMLCYEDRGTIHWTADRAYRNHSLWFYFDVIGGKRYVPSYTANVGFGDELMLNCEGPAAPIEVPMHSAPLSVDLDGDGQLDLLVGGESGFVYFFDRRCLDEKMGTVEVGELEVRKR